MGAMVYTKICPDCNKSPPSPNSTLTPKILFGTEAGNFFFNPFFNQIFQANIYKKSHCERDRQTDRDRHTDKS